MCSSSSSAIAASDGPLFLMEAPFPPTQPTQPQLSAVYTYRTALRSRPSLLLLFLFLCLASGARGGEGKGKETLDYLQPTLLSPFPSSRPFSFLFPTSQIATEKRRELHKITESSFLSFSKTCFFADLASPIFSSDPPQVEPPKKRGAIFAFLFRFAAVKGFLVLTDFVSFSFFFLRDRWLCTTNNAPLGYEKAKQSL